MADVGGSGDDFYEAVVAADAFEGDGGLCGVLVAAVFQCVAEWG